MMLENMNSTNEKNKKENRGLTNMEIISILLMIVTIILFFIIIFRKFKTSGEATKESSIPTNEEGTLLIEITEKTNIPTSEQETLLTEITEEYEVNKDGRTIFKCEINKEPLENDPAKTYKILFNIDTKKLENSVRELSLKKDKFSEILEKKGELKSLKDFILYLLDFCDKQQEIYSEEKIESATLREFTTFTNEFIDKLRDISEAINNNDFSIEDSAEIKGIITDTLRLSISIISKNEEYFFNRKKFIYKLLNLLKRIEIPHDSVKQIPSDYVLITLFN